MTRREMQMQKMEISDELEGMTEVETYLTN